MGKKLAIKGHSTRGKEVIELLEMLGGNDTGYWEGTDVDSTYFINNWTQQIDICTTETDIVVFTLEEFLEKYPFKAGNKVIDCYGNPVTIKSMKWSDDFETMVYDFEKTEDVLCAEDIGFAYDGNTKSANETITPAPDITANVIDKNNCDIACPDGYEFYDENGNLIGNKVKMRPKKPKYPTTYEECIALMHLQDLIVEGRCGYEWRLISNLQKLLLCRDAYWKIAGEQLGLSKPWKHDYLKDANTIRYAIYNTGDEIAKLDGKLYRNYTLCFPTEEMRDAFYKNFKDLIEQCKELL